MANISPALKITLQFEGGYVNNPNDPGGETNYGITIGTARAYGYEGSMYDLPMDIVTHIYKVGYWNSLSLDDLNSQDLANNIFDTAVNMGTGTSARMLQNSINKQGQAQLDEDGIIGPASITEANSLDADNLIKTFQTLRVARYEQLITKNPKLAEFKNGWLRRASLSV